MADGILLSLATLLSVPTLIGAQVSVPEGVMPNPVDPLHEKILEGAEATVIANNDY
jgi:hypothetical protein